MTNTELIRQEIERRLLEDYNSGDTEIDEVAQGVCAALLYFIDSLPKESDKGMNWRTDRPTANVIVVHHTDTKIYDILRRIDGKYYLYTMFGAKEIPIDEIKKWADLEEEEGTICPQKDETVTPEQAMKSLDEIIKSAKKSWEGVDADEYMNEVRGREEILPNIELIQKSWYRQGYIDGINKQEPQWILENLKYKENPKYGQPLETVTNCHQLDEAAEGMVDKLTIFGIEDRCEITVVMPKAMLNRLGMIGYGYGLYLTKSGKNR